MYYEINVAKDGQHYFATAERSLREYDKAYDLFITLQDFFPASKGFSMTLTRYETSGKILAEVKS